MNKIKCSLGIFSKKSGSTIAIIEHTSNTVNIISIKAYKFTQVKLNLPFISGEYLKIIDQVNSITYFVENCNFAIADSNN